jgi:hypothetical protein
MLTSLGFVIGYVYFGGKGEVLDWSSTNSIRLMPYFVQNILFAGTTDFFFSGPNRALTIVSELACV